MKADGARKGMGIKTSGLRHEHSGTRETVDAIDVPSRRKPVVPLKIRRWDVELLFGVLLIIIGVDGWDDDY